MVWATCLARSSSSGSLSTRTAVPSRPGWIAAPEHIRHVADASLTGLAAIRIGLGVRAIQALALAVLEPTMLPSASSSTTRVASASVSIRIRSG